MNSFEAATSFLIGLSITPLTNRTITRAIVKLSTMERTRTVFCEVLTSSCTSETGYAMTNLYPYLENMWFSVSQSLLLLRVIILIYSSDLLSEKNTNLSFLSNRAINPLVRILVLLIVLLSSSNADTG